MAKIFDALIIGAGIVGTACAFELSAAGLSVAIVEQEMVSSGATAAGMGHIVVMDDSPAQLALTSYSQMLWNTFVQEHPEEHEYNPCGTLWIATDEDEIVALHQKQRIYQEYNVSSEVLDTQQLYGLEPTLRPGLAGGLLVPGDSVIYPPKSATLLLQKAKQQGVQFIEGTVTHLFSGGVTLANGDSIHAGAIVVACGIRSLDLLPKLPLRYKKGHLLITDRYPNFIHHQLVEAGYVKNAHATSGDSVSFNVQPRNTGQILIGSSRQLDVSSHEINFPLLSNMLARAIEFLPTLADLSSIRAWTGFRAATEDGLPFIGPYPSLASIWLATGHEGLGITTSLGTARLLTDQILNRIPAIPFEPYLLQRASLKEEKHV